MASVQVVRITGIPALQRKLGTRVVGPPVRKFFTRSAIKVQGNAREKAPVDRGRLRNDIAYEVDPSTMPRWARIGTNVHYAPYQELGTKPFWPPKAPLMAWGARKGLTPAEVQRVRVLISKYGIKPKKFMQDGMSDAIPDIRRYVVTLGDDIAEAMQKG